VFLLDTNVISELRRTRPDVAVANWLSAIPASELFLSAVTLGELQAGVEMTRRQDPSRAAAIEAWIDGIAHSLNVLPMDEVTFRRWAQIMHGRTRDLIEDAMIAATAQVHSLTVVTRNVRDFARFGVPLLNPFQPTP
jgi:toxin FitB